MLWICRSVFGEVPLGVYQFFFSVAPLIFNSNKGSPSRPAKANQIINILLVETACKPCHEGIHYPAKIFLMISTTFVQLATVVKQPHANLCYKFQFKREFTGHYFEICKKQWIALRNFSGGGQPNEIFRVEDSLTKFFGWVVKALMKYFQKGPQYLFPHGRDGQG